MSATEHLNELRKRAHEAVKQNKVYTVRGCFQVIRNALRTRGWVEKLENTHHSINTTISTITTTTTTTTTATATVTSATISITNTGNTNLSTTSGSSTTAQRLARRANAASGVRSKYLNNSLKVNPSSNERHVLSRFVENISVNFLWTDRKDKADYSEQLKNPQMIINKFNYVPFTNKENLNTFLRELLWYYDDENVDVNFPRCFNVWHLEELNEFTEHFRLSACIAFLSWLLDKYSLEGIESVFSINGQIPFSVIDFSMKRCLDFIQRSLHEDIDTIEPINHNVWEHDWHSFLQHHYQFTHEFSTRIHYEEKQRTKIFQDNLVQSVRELLKTVYLHWPQYEIDGYRNLWIIKPANKCRGRGINITNDLTKILNVINPTVTTKNHYIVQKYIERPLIIYKTKFDIRQWFLISSLQPLVIWMYKECYLRFSSQEYSLSNHHESIHLTNHAIQKKYNNYSKRDKRLPSENMWDCYSFQAYLRQIGQQNVWLERIYPGMRKAIVATVLTSQDHMERTANTFELFGADFIICENFKPWLIEINSNPDLAATTSITARMCAQCLEDIIKVTVDRRRDPKADVGNFEMIYRQITPPTPAYIGLSLCIRGKQISSRYTEKSIASNSTGVIIGNGVGHHKCQQNLSSVKLKHHTSRHRQKSSMVSTPNAEHRTMPTFNATDQIRQCLLWQTQTQSNSNTTASWRSASMPNIINRNNHCYHHQSQPLLNHQQQTLLSTSRNVVVPLNSKRTKSCSNVRHTQQSRMSQINSLLPISGNNKLHNNVKMSKEHSPNPKRARNYQRQSTLKCPRYTGSGTSGNGNVPGVVASVKQQVPLSCHLIDVTNNLDHLKKLSIISRKKTNNKVGVDFKLKKISLPLSSNYHRSHRQQQQSLINKYKESTAFNYFQRNQNQLKVANSAPNIHAIGRRIPAWNRCLQSGSHRFHSNYNQVSAVKRLL